MTVIFLFGQTLAAFEIVPTISRLWSCIVKKCRLKKCFKWPNRKPNPPREQLFNDKYKRKSNFYHSGSQFVGLKDTWLTFHEYFMETIDRFLENNMIIVEDQAVLQSVCLSHPEICAYAPYSQVKDNAYFGLRRILHFGGEYDYWRYHPENSWR